ncbi:unnamed protein product [Symbiodinium natans]|uniref:Uncharacterized protein n=1 Tax=Symbiodinium natans TaxID=878477 RepID=A0A812V5F1_9DINO|nr:unnamed protein product [Symbiodinium natans]
MTRRPTPQLTAQQILARRVVATPRSCISKVLDLSGHTADFGRHGSNPREKISPWEDKMPVFKSDLTAGTTKGTFHIPGYQGVTPSCPGFSEHQLRVARAQARSVDKTNIVQIFHQEVVGYGGHVPEAVCNDFGGRKPTDLTTFGHDFKPHKAGALC